MQEQAIERFMFRLRSGKFDPAKARRYLGRIRSYLTPDELSEALSRIARKEALKLRHVDDTDVSGLHDIVPSGFLRDWLIYFDNSESPRSFLALTGLAVLSFAVGRKVFRPLPGNEMIYPPVSVFLLSPAGQARRGQAIKPAARIARDAGLHVLQDEATSEAVVDSLASMKPTAETMIIAEEAATLFGKKDYQQGLASLFCRLMDADDRIEKRTKKGGLTVIRSPLVSCIFGAAPAWFSSMPPEVVLGGLLSRCIVAYEPYQEKYVAFPLDDVPEDRIKAGWKRLVASLAEVVECPVTGKMRFTDGAKRIWQDYYERVGKERRKSETRIATWLSRKPAHTLRVAMTFAYSSNFDVIVDEEMLDRAITLLDLMETKLRVAYEHAGLEKYSRKRQRILDAIQLAGGLVQHSILFRNVHGTFKDREEFHKELQMLEELGLIESYIEKTTSNRRVKYYRLTG